jgi:uncharacterized membrane protein
MKTTAIPFIILPTDQIMIPLGPGEKHPKQDFQVERIAFFSDAVFAIAITLLIIEIHPPIIEKGDTERMAWEKFRQVLPEFFGLTVSFWLIGTSWLRHHQLFKYIDRYDMKFMVINLWLLLTIILFPFSTSFLFNNIFHGAITKLQVYIYLGVPLASMIISYGMYKMVHKKYLDRDADMHFHKALSSQGVMIFSFLLAISWIVIMPFQYHPFGYAFLVIGPIVHSLFKKTKKK